MYETISAWYYTPSQKLACFVLFLKITNTFLENNILLKIAQRTQK